MMSKLYNPKNKMNNDNGQTGIKKYFFFYLDTNELRQVSRTAFCGPEYRVIVQGNNLVKIVSKRTFEKKKVERALRAEFRGESLLEDFRSIKTLIRLVTTLTRLKDKTLGKDSIVLLEIVRLLNSIRRLFAGNFSLDSISTIILDFYLFSQNIIFKAEMFEEFCLATASMWLPGPLFEIIRRMNQISSGKIGDNFSYFHKIISFVVEGIVYILNLFPNTPVVGKIATYLRDLVINNNHYVLDKMRSFSTTKNLSDRLMNAEFRASIKQFFDEVNFTELEDLKRKSGTVAAIIADFTNLRNRVKAYEESSRVEPVAIVIQGPPGCGKSVTMNLVLDSMEYTKYSHVTPSIDGGKDFYDGYQNETIFYMDDVGQQGVSQWRHIINMVSVVRLPLECARAELKGTKFFGSELVVTTTNKFTDLQGITKQDCISDMKALWRRCFVLDMKDMVFASSGGHFAGTARWRSLDVSTGTFIDGFPSYMQKELKKYVLPEPVYTTPDNLTPSETKLDWITWVAKFINVLMDIKRKRGMSNEMFKSQVEQIREDAKVTFVAQGLFESIKDQFGMNRQFSDSESYNSDEESTDEDEMTDSMLNSRLNNLHDDLTAAGLMEQIRNLRSQINYDPIPDNMDQVYLRHHGASMTYLDYEKIQTGNPFSWFCYYVADIAKRVWNGIYSAFDYMVETYRGLSDEIKINLIFLFVVLLIRGMAEWIIAKKKRTPEFFVEQSLEEEFAKPQSTQGLIVAKQTKFLHLFFDDVTTKSVGIVSGHHIVTVSHSVVQDHGYVSVLGDNQGKHVIYDKIKFEVVARSQADDVAVLKLPPNLSAIFSNISGFFTREEKGEKATLVSPFGEKQISCCKHKLGKTSVVYSFPVSKKAYNTLHDFYAYDVRGFGLCGSPILHYDVITGIHVAGSESTNIGLAVRWTAEIRAQIGNLLKEDARYFVPYSLSSKPIEGSVAKFQDSLPASCGSTSNIIPTEISGIYPVTRYPANLKLNGPCTVKDIAKKSYGHTARAPTDELAFGSRVIRRFLNGMSTETLTDREIVKGTELLAGLNPKSSNGFKCKKLKSDYFDFANGESKTFFLDEIKIIEEGILAGKPDWNAFVWVEALKDELRNEEKGGVPRSFRVGTVHHQYLMKKYFGGMVEHIMKNRDSNCIMVGINPLVEWPKMYETLLGTGNIFAGDIAKWDGSMNNMVQDAIAREIASFFEGDAKIIVQFLLEHAVRSLVAVQDDLYLTTHSMPSGHYLTAILNSLVNRFYTAMWYQREVGDNNVDRFLYDVVDYVYGDDKLVGVRANTHALNAVTMREFFDSMYMGFTDANKQDIKDPFQDIGDVTFLKRSFVFHDKLHRIVPALDLRTLQSGLSYYDCTKEYSVVLRDKLQAYQREIFLHPNRNFLLSDFLKRLEAYKVATPVLHEGYLLDLYSKPEDFPAHLWWNTSAQYI